MKLTYKRTVAKKQDVTVDVPDEYGQDDTVRGKVADILLKRKHYVTDLEGLRLGVWSIDEERIELSVELLRDAYSVADEIIAAMAGNQ